MLNRLQWQMGVHFKTWFMTLLFLFTLSHLKLTITELVWQKWYYLENNARFREIFDWKLLHLKSLKIPFHIYFKHCSFWWVMFKVVWPFLHSRWKWVNPLMLTAAKISLTILMKSFRLKHNWQNSWRRKVDHNITNNSPSNIL